ncbi:MAG: cytochrome b/b6 domain-containing protein [Desulfuromonadaceae bacterium]
MKSVLVWDMPIRLFHWLLAACCIASLALAFGSPEQSRAFDWHMLIGLFLVPLLIFRLLWGFTGTTYSRFRSFIYSPIKAVAYLVSMIKGNSERHIGHNPAAGYAILAMLVLVPGCVVSGLLIPNSKIFEELHEIVSFILLGIIGAHFLGILFHTFVHKENVVLSMLTGMKTTKDGMGIRSAHLLVALFLLVLTGIWSDTVIKKYDFTTRRLEVPLAGTVLQFGKSVQDDNTHGENDD